MKQCLVLFFCLALFGCTTNNVTEDDSLKALFQQSKVQGSFALLDNSTNQFTVHNLRRYRDSAFAPGATFDILNGLSGLQTGVLENDSSAFSGDSTGQNFKSAFREGNLVFFQNLASALGPKNLQHWIDTVAYGNKRTGKDLTSFWLNDTLTIRPDEQMGFIKKLYFNQLPFHQINQDAVKRAMLVEQQPLYQLSYKTAEFKNPRNAEQLGWAVGFVEENKHPYFFVLSYTGTPAEGVPALLKKLLEHLGFFKGKK